jgi:glycosyltransferase involved in cell wall biosynthesis
MRILLVGNYVPDGQDSMKLYAEWLKEVCESDGHKVTLIKPKPILFPLLKWTSWHKWAEYVDKFVLFRRELKAQARRHDLVHIVDHSNAMYVHRLDRERCVVTCHDLLAVRRARDEFPGQRTRWTGRVLQRWIESGLRQSRNVICVSQKTYKDFIALFGNTGARVKVIHHALNRRIEPTGKMKPTMMRAFGILENSPYLLHVGGNAWYKNRMGVLKIFSSLINHSAWCDVKLIMAGKPLTQEMRDFVQNGTLKDRVIELGYVPDDELNFLYSNAKAFLFPSLEEGFGWPILEAQACGCPVITSNRPPMQEVAGSAAILVDPEDPASAAEQIHAHAHELDAIAALGFENLKRFQRDEVTSRYLGFYNLLNDRKTKDCTN